MSLETRLTEDERLEWEAEKYSERTLSIRVLTSGRVVICQGALQMIGTFPPEWIEERPEDLYALLKGFCSRPLDPYVPPKARSLVKASLMSDEELSAALTELEDLKIDL